MNDTPDTNRPADFPFGQEKFGGVPRTSTPYRPADFGKRPAPLVGSHATAAEIDAAMLNDLRAWQRRNAPDVLAKNGVRLDGAEFDMLMRLAEKATEQADPVSGYDFPEPVIRELAATYVCNTMPGMTLETAHSIVERATPEQRRQAAELAHYGKSESELTHALAELAAPRHAPRDHAAFDPFGDFTLEPAPEGECTHDESGIAGGGLVCAACGKLLAWIIFKRPNA